MTKASCHTCIYACRDLGQALLSMSTGFASRPMCANQPEAPSRLQPTPIGRVCRNYRPKPPTPQGDVKKIPLAGGLYAYVDAADYEWLSQYNWSVYSGGYAARTEKGKFILMHREIMQPPEGMIVDHIDGNRANNCRFNLRVCTPAENRYNLSKRNGTSSRFKGVGYRKDVERYCARLRHKGELIWLGYFDDEEEAARAYDYAAVGYRGPFARVNFPEEWPPQRVQRVYAEYQAGLKRQGAKGVQGAKARKERGKRRTADARPRRPGRKKAKGPQSKKAERTRRTPVARRTARRGGSKSRKSGATRPKRAKRTGN